MASSNRVARRPSLNVYSVEAFELHEAVDRWGMVFGNSVGTVIFAGYSSMATTQANGNTVIFEAHGDHFTENTTPSLYVGGLLVVGGENASNAPNLVNNNTVNVSLWGCRMGK